MCAHFLSETVSQAVSQAEAVVKTSVGGRRDRLQSIRSSKRAYVKDMQQRAQGKGQKYANPDIVRNTKGPGGDAPSSDSSSDDGNSSTNYYEYNMLNKARVKQIFFTYGKEGNFTFDAFC